MLTLLIKIFIKEPENVSSPRVRARYATVTGMMGIVFNIILFAFKFLIGTISGSISIVADAFNNFSDAGSSIITMIGFRIAGHEADSDHPFGHGRSEYISALVVAMLILLVGFELVKSSIERIIHPSDVDFSVYLVIVLVISMIVKFYMFCYNRSVAKKLDSVALEATAKDSINDVITTGAVLVAAIIGEKTGLHIDGFCGLIVGAIIIKGGYEIFKETSDNILGPGVDRDIKKDIYSIVGEYPEILGIHDLVVHDYGPGRRMISLHAEVDAHGDILLLHDMIDNVERHLQDTLGTQAVIHMDPIVTDDTQTNECRKMVIDIVNKIGPNMSIHDFRMVSGPTHTNIIFDLVLPFESEFSPSEIESLVSQKIREADSRYFAVITVDRPT